MRCVIIGGADIKNYDFVKSYLLKGDFNVFCDCGLKHKSKLTINADLIVGDFDSFSEPKTDTETIVLPKEKDDTDTVFAVKEAVKRGFNEFILIGVIGNRLDHTLANVSVLNYLFSLNKKCLIIDDYSEIQIVSSEPVKISDKYSYFSLLNVFGEAKGVYIKNAKYPLEGAEITSEYQYAVSNEVLKGKTAEVNVTAGKLLLIKVI